VDLDKLYLSGLVSPTTNRKYRLRNDIYHKYLSKYFNPYKLSQLFSRFYEWNKAIDLLEPLVQEDNNLLDVLLEIVNRAMNASANIIQAADYFRRGLFIGFDITEINIWRYANPEPSTKNTGKLVKEAILSELAIITRIRWGFDCWL